jgi:hypothetical protein
MDSNKIKLIIIFIIAMFGAIYLGVSAATAQLEAVLWVVGGATLAGLLALGRNVWVVIPIAGALAGGITLLPGNPQPWYLATPMVGVFMAARFLMRSPMFTFRWTWLDTFMFFQVIALWQAYIRNPTGLALFGGDVYGGRAYFDTAVAITGYFLLGFVKTDAPTFKKVALAIIIVNVADDSLRALSNLSGTFAQSMARFYGNVDWSGYELGSALTYDLDTRFGGFLFIGLTLCLICFAFRRPLSCALPVPLWPFVLMIISSVFIFFSGFRSGLIRAAMYFMAGSLIRRKPMDIVFAAVGGSIFLFILGATVGLTSLPMTAQRVLSFLPFEVSPEIRAAAQGSSDWRFEMWKIVLTSDRYIKNKMFGDGFGYSKVEHEAQMAATEGVRSYQGDGIEMFMMKGSYHGWHVETIRCTGVFGLVIGVCLLFGFAHYAWKAIRHYQNTPYANYVIFVSLPFLIEPFYHILIFGSPKSTYIEVLFAAGIVRLLDNLRVRELAEAKQNLPAAANTLPPENARREPLAITRARIAQSRR